MRPMITKQVERNALSVCVRAQCVHRIAGDRQHPGSQSEEAFMIIANRHQLVVADGRKGPWIKDDHRWCTAQTARGEQLAMLISRGKAWCRLAEGQSPRSVPLRRGHRRAPFGRTSLVAVQSGDICTLLVSANPAVNAASATSAASTYPLRPTLGVMSQM